MGETLAGPQAMQTRRGRRLDVDSLDRLGLDFDRLGGLDFDFRLKDDRLHRLGLGGDGFDSRRLRLGRDRLDRLGLERDGLDFGLDGDRLGLERDGLDFGLDGDRLGLERDGLDFGLERDGLDFGL
ncbi:MAG: hypothetical protein ACYDAN_05460, partial [Candidatus Limnocylindrales bacterium]